MSNLQRNVKRFLCIFLCGVIYLSTCACSSFGFGTFIPSVYPSMAFENDTHLVVGRCLIDKEKGKVCFLELDNNERFPDMNSNIYYYGPYTYAYVLKETELEQHTFLETSYYSTEDQELISQFYDCILTYDYEGQELDRMYGVGPITSDQVEAFYKGNTSKSSSFTFEIDALWARPAYISSAQQRILDYAEMVYNANEEDLTDTVIGMAKPYGDKFLFSIVVSEDSHYNSGAALLQGIYSSKIVSYNPVNDEFDVVFEYNEKDKMIVDFDENGMFTFDPGGDLRYFDFETKKSKLIYDFSGEVKYFDVADDYICAFYGDKEKCYNFVYEKNESIIANVLCEDQTYNKYFW